MEEFTERIKKSTSSIPSAPKTEPQGKSDFKTVKELVTYILDEDERTKSDKKS